MLLINTYSMDNHQVIANLKPQNIWKLFADLAKIPRPSGQEEGVRDWLIGLAHENNWECKVDSTGNLVIYKSAQNSSSEKTLLLQAHMDMVTESDPDKEIDFSKDPITLKQEGEWLMADRTTLGSDNGLGLVAIVGLLLDKEISHPNLQALFTVDEEVGLTGALNLDASLINADYVLNLDTEEEEAVYVSSAGSRDLEAKVNFIKGTTKKSRATCFKLKIDGLRGGHSGVNIHEDRQNAIKLLAQTLSVLQSATDLELVSIEGGNKRNAIPRYAEAEFIVHPDSIEVLRQTHATYSDRLKKMFKEAEPNIEITLAEDGIRNLTFTPEDTRAIINLLQAIPSGVLQMSPTIPDLVQTSNNLGVITSQDDGIEIICMLRSNADEELLNLTHTLISIFSLIDTLTLPENFFGTSEQHISSDKVFLEFSQVSPGWKAQSDNELIDYFQESHQEITGKKASVKAIHAGLECGVILSYLPKAKCISFGPEIRDAHSPVEKVKISSVETFYKVLVNLVEKLAQ